MRTARLWALLGLVCAMAATATAAAAQKQKSAKPLAGYSVVVVEGFTVEQSDATEDFPLGQEAAIHGNVVERLRKLGVFEEVISATETTGAAAPADPAPTPAPGQRLLLSGTVIKYDKGSRAARWAVGFGAGATKIKVRFTFRDAATGEEVFRTERQGKFYGTIAFVGGGKDHAVSESAGDVVDGLIKDLRKNR